RRRRRMARTAIAHLTPGEDTPSVAGLQRSWSEATGCGGVFYAAVAHLVPHRRPEANKEKPLSPLSGRRIAWLTAPPRGCDGPGLVTSTRGQLLDLPALEAYLAKVTITPARSSID